MLQLTLNFEVDECDAFEETAVLEAYCEAFVEEAGYPENTACLTDRSECPATEARRRRSLLEDTNKAATIVLGGTFGGLTAAEVVSVANGVLLNTTRLGEVKGSAVSSLESQGWEGPATLLANTDIVGKESSIQELTIECTNSLDCEDTPTRPICQSNFCVACSPIASPAVPGNCPEDSFCRSGGYCSNACETDDDCNGVTPICKDLVCKPSDYEVFTEEELRDALSDASAGQSIQVVGEITLTTDNENTAALTIDKPISIVGKRNSVLQSPADDTAAITFISVTANDVSFSRDLKIRHLKNPVSVGQTETAVLLNADNFVSAADVEFVEFGYTLRGTFTISGSTSYVGALGNNHRHFGIYSLRGDSAIQDVVFDFPEESTTRSIFILGQTGGSGDEFKDKLTVKNVRQADQEKACRQFFVFEGPSTNIDSSSASLHFENNVWNDAVGGIFLYFGEDNPMQNFLSVVIANNVQGNAGNSSYKGLFYLSGDAGSNLEVGNVDSFQSFGNDSPGQRDPGILRSVFFWLQVPEQEENTFAVDGRIYAGP